MNKFIQQFTLAALTAFALAMAFGQQGNTTEPDKAVNNATTSNVQHDAPPKCSARWSR